nr:UvrD-helicase domain-containing protein [Butyrivibrio sp.]
MGFTTEQQAVIDARKQNVLVSAAAGSGKTTVLVERIIQLITGDDNVDIDRLLVVTFTKAAASQMKEKVLAAISKKLSENPDNKHLQRQETLVHGAQITTIDSFCQYVIRNNFNEIGLDPSYRVLDEGEKKLIMADVLADLLEEKYAEGDKRFINAMEYFSTGSDDKKVEEFILQLYDYAMSMPWPEQWLRQRSNDYELSSEDFEAEEFVKLAKKNAEYTMLECRERMENGLKLSNEPDGPYFYGDLFEKEMDMYDAVISKIEASEKAGIIITFDELRSMLLNITYDRLPSKKDDSVNADKRELASSHRKYAKDKTGALIKHLFSEDKETILKHMEIAKDPVKELCELTITFMDKFSEKKRERGVI